MKNYSFKYGRGELLCKINEKLILNTLLPRVAAPIIDVKEAVIRAIENPTASASLKNVIKKGETVVIVVSDITRLWIKTDQFLIHLIDYLNAMGVEDSHIDILIALGTHRPSNEGEKQAIVGNEVYNRIKIHDHDCFDSKGLDYVGESSFNTPIFINKRIVKADRVILTGGIAFHLFAGFGGGAKGMVPGVAGLETIQHNHRLTFNEGINTGLNPKAASNKIDGNPMREDITEICRMINPDFLINAVLDADGRFLKFVAGDFQEAWLEGCEIIREVYGIELKEKSDIIIASAGGYPKDINLYQTVKTMDNCLYGGKENSVIILASECSDGLGASEFLNWFQYKTLEEMEKALKKNFTVPGYAAYKAAYTGVYRKLILISTLPRDHVEKLGFLPANSLDEALDLACKLSPLEPKITLMPYGGNTLPIIN
ncbi:conserved hypothetical protein [Alkaliphilus metalliredigens QYMF]|uniref:Uncharacterized protein n=1 Tax=Alkaliphilus metalliredigens (strain QYMF) TaxID=293826 RepID=A6TUX2_ALKMQ|nr:nickel-dependent lactate racemase [Alkaliphilus metalliredigens]ABR49990.1 conserved hypothetical protein [Alkaliphilus metalliredigens QYMF]